MPALSVILPAYNEEAMLPRTAEVLEFILGKEKIDYELIFVDDGSKDGTWEEIEKAHGKNEKIRGVHFSRNFGKEAAILAGLEAAKGNCAAVMDCDLQHPPEVLVEMYRLWDKGFEIVEGIKKSRGKESGAHRKAAGIFYKIMSKAAGIDMERASDFKLLDKRAVNVLLSMPERNPFFRATSSWIGFKKTYVEFDVQERAAGVSKWSTKKLVRYAIDNIAGFSTAPMQIVTWIGLASMICATIMAVCALIRTASGHPVSDMAALGILILLIGSILMISVGIIGYYIARIFEEVKRRPRYIVSKTI